MMDTYRIRGIKTRRLLPALAIFVVVGYEIYRLLTSGASGSLNFKCSSGSLQQLATPFALGKLDDFSRSARDKNFHLWYYENIFKHPLPRLRLPQSFKIAGAEPILSQLPLRERDITLVTQTSADRLEVVEVTAKLWGGEMVVAVYVRNQNSLRDVFRRLHTLHSAVEALGRCRLNVYVVVEPDLTDEEAEKAQYPVNAMRNVALEKAKTDLVFILDADFLPSPGLHESLTQNDGSYRDIRRRTMELHQLLVTPRLRARSFQEKGTARGRSAVNNMPRTKVDLKRAWINGSIDCFHCDRNSRSHESTDFDLYFHPNTTEMYSVKYKEGFEPYFIAARELIPKYDSRFRGYGKNKQSHVYHCDALAFQFTVLPNAYVFAVPHPDSAAYETYAVMDATHRDQMTGLYNRFKKEVKQAQLTAPLNLNKCLRQVHH